MRLIDADEFKKQIAGMVIVNNYSADKANKLCELIDCQPTAYDVDKVVEWLEQIKTDNSCKNCTYIEKCDELQEFYNPSDEVDLCALVTKELSIKIVESGGIQYPDSSNTDTENVTANWKVHLTDRFNRFE